MSRLLQVLFWSVIAAAFVGPGTVTTCARAGAEFGFTLLWAIAFSTAACLILQEATARLTSVTGRSLGQALRERYAGAGGVVVLLLVLGAILMGAAAYQAGNLLGASAGASLAVPRPGGFPDDRWRLLATLLPTVVAAGLLAFARSATVAKIMGLVVAVMGISFVATAVSGGPPPGRLLSGIVVPAIPSGAGLLVIGVIGTTVVPYNLFLGSSLARGQSLGEIRFGLTVAILLGGLISMAILIVGSFAGEPFSFERLGSTLAGELGGWARVLFAVGLFCAGLSSAITAPLAAALTAQGLFDGGSGSWSEHRWRYRVTWIAVLGVGAGFALSSVKPVEMIVAAQAFNGVLLPFVTLFLWVVVNDRGLMGAERINGVLSNVLTGAVFFVTLLLGLAGIFRAAASLLGREAPSAKLLTLAAVTGTALAAAPVVRWILVVRRSRSLA